MPESRSQLFRRFDEHSQSPHIAAAEITEAYIFEPFDHPRTDPMCCMREASNARRTRTCQRLCEVGSGYRLRLRWETTSTGLICMEFSVQVYLPRHPPPCAERANGEGDVQWGHATAIWCRYVLTQPLRPSRGMGPLPVGTVLSLNVTLAACNGGRRADQHKIPGICPEQGNCYRIRANFYCCAATLGTESMHQVCILSRREATRARSRL